MTEKQFEQTRFAKGNLARLENDHVFPIIGVDFERSRIQILTFPPDEKYWIAIEKVKEVSKGTILK